MNEETVAELALAAGLRLPAERLADLAAALTAQIAAGGGSSAEALEGLEPATRFEPRWEP